MPVQEVGFVKSVAALVILGVIRVGGSVFGRCRRCVLLSNLSVVMKEVMKTLLSPRS